MPWEKSFSEEQALEKAMCVFWQKGFEAASINDLIEETGITRGSLYNAFGGKRALFLKSLLRYDEDRQAMLARLEAMDDPRRAIESFFDTTVANTAADRDKKGCFLFNTALEIANHDDSVRKIVADGVAAIEAFFRRSIEVGQARGEIPADRSAEATAKTLLALVVAIRVLGRGLYQQSALEVIAEEAKKSIG